jgi:FKBP-type peptidyl-prolyl cis-trans isomerase FkpA/FKBP-type peptidyl-prolyl cis-trans isomerase FklB
MLPSRWLAAATIALALAACGPASAPPEPKLGTDDERAVYALGLLIAQRIEQFSLSEAELANFAAGVRDGVLGNQPKIDPATVEGLLQAFANGRSAARAQSEKAAATEYLAKMAAEPGATTAPSGYVIRTLTEGSGASPGASDVVKVHYHGTLRDGKVFDSSVDRGTPAEFPLSRVIPCWTQSLQTMKVGGKYKVTCPSDIAYGDRGSPPSIGPGAALTFEVELLEIRPGEAATPDPHGHAAPPPKPESK